MYEDRLFSPFAKRLSAYAASNPDLIQVYGQSNYQAFYEHLKNNGIQEERKFSYFFDADFYRSNNSDLGGLSGEVLFNHFKDYGIQENRRFSTFVDLGFFKAANPDLITLNQTDLYKKMVFNTMDIQNGFNNARRLTVSYDPLYYLSKNPDLAASIGTTFQLFEHFYTYGLKEDRTSSDIYDSGTFFK